MQPTPPESSSNPEFRKVASNLYRRTSSGVYYALVKRGGKQFRKSLGTTDRALAQRLLGDFREAVGSLVSHDASKLTFEIVAERWQAGERHALKESTALRRQHYLEGVTPFFRGVTLRNVTQGHCERWAIERGATIAGETFNHELGVMKAVFDYAKDQGWLLRNPAQSIKRRRVVAPEITVPTLPQFQELVAAIRRSDGRETSQASARDGADLVELLAYSGCRLDEARQLRWEHVTWPRGDRQGMLRVTGGERRTKNYESRSVPMTDSLFGLLSRLHTERQPAPGDAIVRIQSAKKCLATACRNLDFPPFTHHDLRHFFITTCLESGVDPFTISKWAGHKDGGALAMKRYGHLREEHSSAQIKRVNFAPAAQPALNPKSATPPAALVVGVTHRAEPILTIAAGAEHVTRPA